eukprot:CAMPEP_0113323886 /NCGR_PEP_ID=MMETSP0010_2-20120614/16646_1 /TAXON_ID=216773 ORGANISM="Corethron hystrix, Strain 308" /NCGR_SAMPLE_ID=MMETSP0010_2 /ASSEMBLY_ACC=CAM_ASM_000155 /LENGTH=351 /DNA_ID=CAMNT_0000183019 /DNA_START=249 /DNA_END=1304 /DNA_ORIENTATION=- /assembly_acc=CAM_ASM_000155
MMDGAYFTGRREILAYFNNLLELDLGKIEETASGAVACQIMDYMFPGSIPMRRVNWEAKASHEYVKNYKLLQAAFTKNHIQKHVDVDRLIRAKYQDNLEFCQWLKAFCEHTASDRPDYDPVAARSASKGGKKMSTSTTKSTVRSFPNETSRNSRSKTTPAPMLKENISKQKSNQRRQSKPSINRGCDRVLTSPSVVADAKLIKKNTDLTARNEALEQNIIELEKERDFYFGKLRDIEVMCQSYEEKPENERSHTELLKDVFRVLYATTDDEVFVDNEGKLTEGFIDDLGDYHKNEDVAVAEKNPAENEPKSYQENNVVDDNIHPDDELLVDDIIADSLTSKDTSLLLSDDL